MRIILALSLFLTLATGAKATSLKCAEYTPPKGNELLIYMDGGSWNFKLPNILSGDSLREVVLFVLPNPDNGQGEVAAPVAFSIVGKNAVGEFYTSGSWVSLELVAYYGKDICGPKLSAYARM